MPDWKKEVARDLIAIGSIPFYVLVLARALIGPFWDFVYHLSFSALILLVFFYFIKKSNYYISRALVLFIFTVIFYGDNTYTLFASAILVLMLVSLFYLKKHKEEIINGIVLGLVASSAGYYLATLI